MKDTKIWDKWIRDPLFGKGKSKSVKYWTALARVLISQVDTSLNMLII